MPNRKRNDPDMIIEHVTQVVRVPSRHGIYPLYLFVDGLFNDTITK
jgi:hypothetical protein